jgi:hypothetical protein
MRHATGFAKCFQRLKTLANTLAEAVGPSLIYERVVKSIGGDFFSLSHFDI